MEVRGWWKNYVWMLACVLLGLQAYRNAQNEPSTQAQARRVACDVKPGQCELRDDAPRTIDTDFVKRQYVWRASIGRINVTCTRAFILFGKWTCTPEHTTWQ